MSVKILNVIEFLHCSREVGSIILDTRSESEYNHASVPGAFNLPILNDEERVLTGTLYKNKGKEEAILKGFELVGPRFHEIIKKAVEIAPEKEVFMYCWRGGMRSNIMAWLLSTSSFNVHLMEGGYKAFRKFAMQAHLRPLSVIVLGGPTGSGKTEILDRLMAKGEQVLQLEYLANHKGSAFGALGQPSQPSSEHFENMIARQWNSFDPEKPVWIENESRSIGACMIPAGIYALIRNSPLINVNVGRARRVKRITDEYGIFPHKILAEISIKLEKRLGPQHLKLALEFLNKGDFDGWLEIILNYYDKLYNYGNSIRNPDMMVSLDLTNTNENEFASNLINTAYNHPVFSSKVNAL